MEYIRTMEAIEHIRCRPGMYIGRIGNGENLYDGIYTLLKEILLNSIDEHLAGYGNSIIIDVQNNVVKVRDFGRGISFDKLFSAATDLNTGGRYDSVEYKKTVGLNGVGLKVANALSRHCTITSYQSGEYISQTFSKGVLISTGKGQTSENDGVFVEFIPDDEILDEYNFRMDILSDIVYQYCCLHKGLKITLNGAEYISENGLMDMLDKTLNHAYRYAPIHICEERFEIAFTHVAGSEEHVRSYVNDHHTTNGGTHEDAFRKALAYALSNGYNREMPPEQSSNGLVAVIKVNIQCPLFADSEKTTLASPYMWYDLDDNHGPTIYETFKTALMKGTMAW